MHKSTDIELTDKELRIVNFLAKHNTHTQRDIAVRLGCSLGLTNIILKRLITMGYVKTKQLNAKKVQYILTPKGFAEKTRKSYQYLLKTIHSIRMIKGILKEMVEEKITQGERHFIVMGSNELADIVELTLRDMDRDDLSYARAGGYGGIVADAGCIIHTEGIRPVELTGRPYVDVLSALGAIF